MKKTLYILYIILTTLQVSFSQTGWVQQTSGITQHLNSIFFTSIDTGWAVGNNGNVIKTTNGGSNWNLQATLNDRLLRTVNFINSSTGFTSGMLSNIYKTTNAGLNWIGTYSGFDDIFEIFFCNSTVGYAIARTYTEKIIKTINGGNNWIISLGIDTGNFYLNSLYFIDQNTGWVAGTLLLKTTNAGINWFSQPTGGGYGWSDVFFTSSNTGYITGIGGSVMKTTNGGNTWNPQLSGTPNSLISIYFFNSNTGWMVGWQGTIIKTTNGGDSWMTQYSGVNTRLSCIQFVSSTTGYISADSGKIFKTTNGGDPIGIEPISSEIPIQFSLSLNYPNPFNPSTNIKFALPKNNYVTLKIYDALGREIATLVNEQLKAGTYQVDWDGSNYANGVYYYKLMAGDFVETKKMLMIK
jgi:photosystem II stability/assembly factor-like uncharacterized protein